MQEWRFEARKPEEVYMGFIHHEGSGRDRTAAELNQIKLQEGLAGIGYNFVIRKDGTIEEGRQLDVWAAHRKGYNRQGVAICCNGNLEIEYLTIKQWHSVVHLARWLTQEYNLEIWLRDSDVHATLCPGKNFPWKDFLREVWK